MKTPNQVGCYLNHTISPLSDMTVEGHHAKGAALIGDTKQGRNTILNHLFSLRPIFWHLKDTVHQNGSSLSRYLAKLGISLRCMTGLNLYGAV